MLIIYARSSCKSISLDPIMDCEFVVREGLCNTKNPKLKTVLAKDCPASCGLCNCKFFVEIESEEASAIV